VRTFFNRKENIVSEAIDGLVAASGGRIRRFAPESHARVVVRSDWDKSKVAIVSGGGSGHEPSHAGMVGRGLLTAAVCGEVFASPSVDAVLAAVVAVTGPAGCLLIVKNYTGDRLNFGLAVEKAKAMGLAVEMVIVGDDIALPDAPQPRGLAGTLYFHKLAGHMADAGNSLKEIVQALEALKPRVFTIGVARDTCTVPGSEKHNRIAPDEVEIGLGIHGEPGVETAQIETANELAARLATRVEKRLKGDKRYALLFNNLGGLSTLECLVLLSDLMRTSIGKSLKLVAGPATAMTALDMPGFSLSFLELDGDLENVIKAPAGSVSFPAFEDVVETHAAPVPDIATGTACIPSSNDSVRHVVEAIIETCLAMEADINALDAKVGDGDTGSTLANAARSVKSHLDALPFADGSALLSRLSDIKRKAMGGSSGVLLAILLAKGSEAYRESEDWVESLVAGLDAMQRYGGAKRGDRTMVDALRPALEALRTLDIGTAARKAREGANATSTMERARAGRSSYLEARSLVGTNDPGAEAVARIFEALATG
jgi:dihydroxyacetone kinase